MRQKLPRSLAMPDDRLVKICGLNFSCLNFPFTMRKLAQLRRAVFLKPHRAPPLIIGAEKFVAINKLAGFG